MLRRKPTSLDFASAAHDVQVQQDIFNQVATLIDTGQRRSTHGKALSKINAANLRHAHQLLESGRTIGKVVLAGFD